MAVVAFPSPTLTSDDETEIFAKAFSGGYSCRRALSDKGNASIVLLNDRGETRGYVTKEHGMYALSNARRHVVAESRMLEDILSALVK